MDKFAKIEDEKATSTVHGARWLSNEYLHKAESQPRKRRIGFQRKYHNYTTMADTGDENDLTSAFGWLGGTPGRSLTQDEVWGMMYRIKGEIIEEMWVATDPTYYDAVSRTYGYGMTGVIIRGRADSFAAEKAKKLRQLRQSTGLTNLVWDIQELKDTYKWNVGRFGMFSDFVDPAPILKALGTENAIDSDANYYEATATWRYRNLSFNGIWRKWYNGKKTFSPDTGDGIKSWKDHHFSYDFCKNGQEITEPAIYEGIERFVSRRPVYERRRRTGQNSRFSKYTWVRVGWEPCVVQDYQDLN